MDIYTIGFTKKSAEEFFELLRNAEIDLLLDVRLNTKSQLAGFAKSVDLPYFMDKICNANYLQEPEFAPTEELLSSYKKGGTPWEEYVPVYRATLMRRNAEKTFLTNYKDKYNRICLLCSEATPDKCHRRLLAEYLKEYDFITGVDKIIHL